VNQGGEVPFVGARDGVEGSGQWNQSQLMAVINAHTPLELDLLCIVKEGER
jgi:hypothetical protein